MSFKAKSSDEYARLDNPAIRRRGNRLLNLLIGGGVACILLFAYYNWTKPTGAKTLTAVARLTTNGDSKAEGTIHFRQKSGGDLEISGVVKNIGANSLHGFHIHESGDLTNGCASTGSHFNPEGKTHGAPDADTRHAGDLGNIVADSGRLAYVAIRDHILSLKAGSEFGVVGRAVVVHAGPDDLGLGGDEESLKTGNAGARVACGVIELV